MVLASVLWIGKLCMAAAPATIPLHIAGPWAIEVGPGSIHLAGKRVVVEKAVHLDIEPPALVKVTDEKYDRLPVFNEKAPGWLKGVKMPPLQAEECSATGLLTPGSFRMKDAPGSSRFFVAGEDYGFDEFWATFGRIEGGAIAENQPVYCDYEYAHHRLDSLVAGVDGVLRVVRGAPAQALALPPAVNAGETVIANVFISGETRKLTEESLFPVDANLPPAYSGSIPVAERLLPRTLAKLREGKPVVVVAFGDSVTCGGGVGANKADWYQYQFQKLLQARFPKSPVTMLTAGWGGASSKAYLDSPRGSEHDFVRDVLEPKPDLVTIEFVNDAYLDEAGVAAHYAGVVGQLQQNGSEVILITPHLVRPDWMKVETMKFDEDPRPYVRGLRQFGEAHGIAVADASAEWCALWRRGIPYITLLANAINHPDVRGHELFARVLLGLFPEQ
ncbi:MAG TPA: SGNH/GDSL hydrolase family protein [Candidatus Hydrogenedentes bacterium]|nr:SGNH/GDSL hydrolase family protein [Candidatus Hydrogenedentota bacterium]HPC14945.1 SGNH/GDSL hydrolase family protein [Candidatus Hydrogenedentota bacterium]HRT18809.1 SGNH/GDSL hydrolase family protein [Candidatus Hydrogenedentota bacterium]HRT65746.1 SGNH/GDSL hydrolase family protein [Candidatus Hydrogenedentota bacterium]